MYFPTKPISSVEIVSVIQKLRPKKSPGHDKIINKIAKNLSKKSILFLTHTYNQARINIIIGPRPLTLAGPICQVFKILRNLIERKSVESLC